MSLDGGEVEIGTPHQGGRSLRFPRVSGQFGPGWALGGSARELAGGAEIDVSGPTEADQRGERGAREATGPDLRAHGHRTVQIQCSTLSTLTVHSLYSLMFTDRLIYVPYIMNTGHAGVVLAQVARYRGLSLTRGSCAGAEHGAPGLRWLAG